MRNRAQASGLRVRSSTVLLALLCVSLPSLGGELLSGRLYTLPEKVFVNQAFEIHFEVEVSQGSEMEDLRISDFPNNPDLLTLGKLETTSRTRVERNGQAVDVVHFAASARCYKPIEQTFNPNLQCMLVERRSSGFFSHWQSHPRQLKLAPFVLRVQPLPDAGRPAHFSGAVGVFRLAGHLSRTAVQPGDIITLTLELSGQGWLNAAAMPAPPATPLFKTYPVKERLREPLRVQTEQVFIPQSTNAAEIAAARFSFFNPAAGAYEESVAGPFRLTFSAVPSTPQTSGVRVISTTDQAEPDAPGQTVTIERMNQSLRHAIPLLVACASALAAFFVFFQLYGSHTRLALFVGVALLAAGGVVGYVLSNRPATVRRVVTQRTEALFAPARAAMPLFILSPETPVTPLETVGCWVRVDAAGRRGWIPSSSLSERTLSR